MSFRPSILRVLIFALAVLLPTIYSASMVSVAVAGPEQESALSQQSMESAMDFATGPYSAPEPTVGE